MGEGWWCRGGLGLEGDATRVAPRGKVLCAHHGIPVHFALLVVAHRRLRASTSLLAKGRTGNFRRYDQGL